MHDKFVDLRLATQEIIDLASQRKFARALEKLSITQSSLDDLVDQSTKDEELRELSRYQVLLSQLRERIHN